MKGVLLFAFNNERVNYFKLAKICAQRIQDHWNLPVCVVSDEDQPKRGWPTSVTHWRKVDRPKLANSKSYYDYGLALSFWNVNRCGAYDLSPFDQTIVIDTDLLVQTTNIPDAWSGKGLAVSRWAHSVDGTPMGNDVRYLSLKHKLPMYWATVVCFDRSPVSKEFFDLWLNAVRFYHAYAAIYGFSPGPMRNDFAVSVALEKLKGSAQSGFFDLHYSIPTLQPGSTLLSLDPMIALVKSQHPDELDMVNVCSDLHVMNKKSILEVA